MGIFAELRRRNVFRVAGVYSVVGWILAQIANILEESLGLPAWFDGVIVALLLIGLPVALIFAWAFELTPEGVVRTERVPAGDSITAETGRKLDVAIVVSLVLLVLVLAWDKLEGPTMEESPAASAPEQPEARDATSVAVLPFADLSPDGDQAYFSDGLAEEILNVLVDVRGLEVASRTSSFQFKGQGLGIPEIATRLMVRHVVEGSVRKSGNTIRVTAQLIDAEDDRHLWSNTYDRPLSAENVFAIQDDIAQSIVTALSEALGIAALDEVEVTAKTRNLPAYELYLKARPLLSARSSFEQVEDYLAQAVAQDPEFAEAWELRAAAMSLWREYRRGVLPIEETDSRASEYARRALEVEPRSAVAMAVLAKIDIDANTELRRSFPLDESIQRLSEALEISPHDGNALNWRGLLYRFVGDFDAALVDFQNCIRYEPYHAPCSHNLQTTYFIRNDPERSWAVFVDSMDKGIAMLSYGDFRLIASRGEEYLFKALTNRPDLLYGWHQHDELYDAYRDPDGEYHQLIASIKAFAEQSSTLENDALRRLLVGLGDFSELNIVGNPWVATEGRQRNNPLFKAYLRDTGVIDYWNQYGYPEFCKPLGEDDFDCD